MSSETDTEKLNGASNQDEKEQLTPADNEDMGVAKSAEAEPMSAPSPSHSSSGDQSDEGSGRPLVKRIKSIWKKYTR